MTTLVALATKDALVMGCDSLGTVTRDLVNPFDLIDEFFDPEQEWRLKTDPDGKPLLKKFDDIYRKAQQVAFNQMTHVDKMVSLKPFPMGVMTTGLASVGNRTIKSLINEFKERHSENTPLFQANFQDYTPKKIADSLLGFINGYYEEFYPEGKTKPYLELMIGGYSKDGPFPRILRVLVHQKKVEETFPEASPFGIAFGGQMQEIQRIVFGTDGINKLKLVIRTGKLFDKYRDLLHEFLKKQEKSIELRNA